MEEGRKGKVRRLRRLEPASKVSCPELEPGVAPPAPPVNPPAEESAEEEPQATALVTPPVPEPKERVSEPSPLVVNQIVDPLVAAPSIASGPLRLMSDWRVWAAIAIGGVAGVLAIMLTFLPTRNTSPPAEGDITLRVRVEGLTVGETVSLAGYVRREGKLTLAIRTIPLSSGEWIEVRVTPGFVYIVPNKAGLVATPPPTVDGRGNVSFLVPENWERGKPFVVTLSPKK